MLNTAVPPLATYKKRGADDMNKATLGTDFTVTVDSHGSWCDWFPTRAQAVSYARLVVPLVKERVCVLDCQGAVVAQFNPGDSGRGTARSPLSSTDRGAPANDVPLANPIH
jgi:hypothetical protein